MGDLLSGIAASCAQHPVVGVAAVLGMCVLLALPSVLSFLKGAREWKTLSGTLNTATHSMRALAQTASTIRTDLNNMNQTLNGIRSRLDGLENRD